MAVADWTVAELLARLAAREPAPGGGSASALTGAAGAALVEMAAAFAAGRANADEGRCAHARDRARALRAQLLALADADLSSYQPVLQAMALEHGSPERASAVRGALSAATEVPLAITAGAAEVAQLGALIAGESSRELAADALTAVLLAEASTSAAAGLVELNLRARPDDDRLAQAREYARRAAAARSAALASAS